MDCTDSEETTPRGESKSGGLSLKRGAAIFSGASRQAKSPAKGGNEDDKAKTEKERKKERKTLKKEKKAATSAGGEGSDQTGGHGGAALNNLKIGFSKTIMTVRKRKKKRSILVPPSIFIMPPG